MSKASKTAGDCVSSTSGGETASNPATQAVSARTDGQQALGLLRFDELRFGSPDAMQAAVEMLKSHSALSTFCDLGLTDCTRGTFDGLADELELLSMHLRQALAALPDDPKNNTARESLRLACKSGFDVVRNVAEIDMESMEMARRLLARPAVGSAQ